jgi:hypothetical protein
VDTGRLADDLLTLEIGFTASFPGDAAVAGQIERAAAGIGRPDLMLRARLARAVIMSSWPTTTCSPAVTVPWRSSSASSGTTPPRWHTPCSACRTPRTTPRRRSAAAT